MMPDLPTEQPLVSVIIPVYNAGKYLRETLDCVCGQTLKEIEIICVDDGSTDDSLEILREYAAKDSRMRILQQKNQYAGVARNNGMAVARGKYLSFLDADDLFEPEMLAKMSARAEETGAEMVCCDVDFFEDGSQIQHPMSRLVHGLAAFVPPVFCPVQELGTRIFRSFVPPPWNKLFLAGFVRETGREWLDTPYANDLTFVLYAIFRCRRMALLDEAPVHYRERRDSISHTKQRDETIFFRSWGELRAWLIQDDAPEEVMHAFANTFLDHLWWFISSLPLRTRERLLAGYAEQYDRQVFRLLELPEEMFEDKAKLRKMRGMFNPVLSVVVPYEPGMARAELVIRSSSSPVFCGYELVYCLSVEDDAYEGMLEACARKCPQLRVYRGEAAKVREFCRAPRVGYLPAGCKLMPNAGPVLQKLGAQPLQTVELGGVCVRQPERELFVRCRSDRRSWCLFGRAFLTVLYREAVREIWLFGRRIAVLR